MKKLLILVFLSLLFGVQAHAEGVRYSSDCKVIFMEQIGSEEMKQLLSEISLVKGCKEGEAPQVVIESDGGTVAHAIVAFEQTKDKVCTEVQQNASSAAVVLVLAGKKGCRKMHKDAFMLLHTIKFPEEEASGGEGAAGLSEEQQGYKERITDRYMSIISQRSDLSKKTIKHMMKTSTFISAEQAKEMGLIDIIVE